MWKLHSHGIFQCYKAALYSLNIGEQELMKYIRKFAQKYIK